jgi:hypothetical protein
MQFRVWVICYFLASCEPIGAGGRTRFVREEATAGYCCGSTIHLTSSLPPENVTGRKVTRDI